MTNDKFKKNVELSEPGLSNKALYTLLSGNVNAGLLSRIIELVCNHGKLNVQAAGDLMKQVHAKMPELGDRLYHYEQKTGVRL